MKKMKFAEKEKDFWEVFVDLNLKELQVEMVMAAKKHIPKMLSLDEVMGLIRQYDYMITTPQFLKIVKKYSIPIIEGSEMIYFDRDKLLEFFRCDGRPIPNLEHDLIRFYIQDQKW